MGQETRKLGSKKDRETGANIARVPENKRAIEPGAGLPSTELT